MATDKELLQRQIIEKRNQSAQNYNTATSSSVYTSARDQAEVSLAERNDAYQRYESLVANNASSQSISDAQQALTATNNIYERDRAIFNTQYSNAQQYQAAYDSYNSQLAQLATASTEPISNQTQQFTDQTAAAVADASNSESSQPPVTTSTIGIAPGDFEFYNSPELTVGISPYGEQDELPDPSFQTTMEPTSTFGIAPGDFEIAGNTGISPEDFVFAEQAPSSTQIQTATRQAREQVVGDSFPDQRFRISLAQSADYFYNATPPGILAPLKNTNGVIFPYTPQVSINYAANYTPMDVVHTNYKFYSYKNSAIENISITADFTAQNTVEANYMLAVIHFFRSATKMFYGQDQNPSRGIPPPLCYITGYGQYQFDYHPVVITGFMYTLPSDIDYISAYPTNSTSAIGGIDLAPYRATNTKIYDPLSRLRSLVSSGIGPGGNSPPPTFNQTQNINESTRVPTKINIQLSCLPIATRNAVSTKFSLKNYANGSLLRGSVNPGTGGGMW